MHCRVTSLSIYYPLELMFYMEIPPAVQINIWTHNVRYSENGNKNHWLKLFNLIQAGFFLTDFVNEGHLTLY